MYKNYFKFIRVIVIAIITILIVVWIQLYNLHKLQAFEIPKNKEVDSSTLIAKSPGIHFYARITDADDIAMILINGIGAVQTGWRSPRGGDSGWVDITRFLKPGQNLVRFYAKNTECCNSGGYFQIKNSKGQMLYSTGKKWGHDENISVIVDETTVINYSSKTPECDFKPRPGEQLCFGASGSHCDGDYIHPPQRYYNNCTVKVFMTNGSRAHDLCCIRYPNGYRCDGWKGEPFNSPNKLAPCEPEWRKAEKDSALWRGQWVIYGPYYR